MSELTLTLPKDWEAVLTMAKMHLAFHPKYKEIKGTIWENDIPVLMAEHAQKYIKSNEQAPADVQSAEDFQSMIDLEFNSQLEIALNKPFHDREDHEEDIIDQAARAYLVQSQVGEWQTIELSPSFEIATEQYPCISFDGTAKNIGQIIQWFWDHSESIGSKEALLFLERSIFGEHQSEYNA